jgi:hypothetical protein
MNKQVLIEIIEHLDQFHTEYKGGNDYTLDDFWGISTPNAQARILRCVKWAETKSNI